VAREYELALPAELSAGSRVELVRAFGGALLDRYGVAVDISIHAPHRDGDQRNWHAHVLTTTRKVEETGLGAKTRVLDDRKTGPAQVVELRALWAELSNGFLERDGLEERVDHRSLTAIREAHQKKVREHRSAGRLDEARDAAAAALEADRPAQVHMGPAASAMERKAAREAQAAGRAYEPATRIGAEVFQARQFRNAMQDYLRAWVGFARQRYRFLSQRLEAEFARIKGQFVGRQALYCELDQRERQARTRLAAVARPIAPPALLITMRKAATAAEAEARALLVASAKAAARLTALEAERPAGLWSGLTGEVRRHDQAVAALRREREEISRQAAEAAGTASRAEAALKAREAEWTLRAAKIDARRRQGRALVQQEVAWLADARMMMAENPALSSMVALVSAVDALRTDRTRQAAGDRQRIVAAAIEAQRATDEAVQDRRRLLEFQKMLGFEPGRDGRER
jgi:hypothetical protein